LVSAPFPEVVYSDIGSPLSSCSRAGVLDRQEPFVNPTLSNHALALLARLFRYGTISYHGAFVSLSSTAGARALPIDPKYWQRLRHGGKRRPVVPTQSSSLGLIDEV